MARQALRPRDIGTLLLCPYCSRTFSVCKPCFRGRKYCSSPCSHRARKESLQRAAERYRQSEQGAIANRERQRRFRRKRALGGGVVSHVTHQGLTLRAIEHWAVDANESSQVTPISTSSRPSKRQRLLTRRVRRKSCGFPAAKRSYLTHCCSCFRQLHWFSRIPGEFGPRKWSFGAHFLRVGRH